MYVCRATEQSGAHSKVFTHTHTPAVVQTPGLPFRNCPPPPPPPRRPHGQGTIDPHGVLKDLKTPPSLNSPPVVRRPQSQGQLKPMVFWDLEWPLPCSHTLSIRVGTVQEGGVSEDKQPPWSRGCPWFSGALWRQPEKGDPSQLPGWASPRRYLATPPCGHPGASRPQAIEVSAVLASLELTR